MLVLENIISRKKVFVFAFYPEEDNLLYPMDSAIQALCNIPLEFIDKYS